MAVTNPEVHVVSLEGTLDVERARALLALALADGHADLVLDLRGVREIHDAAIALIVRAMEAQRRGLVVRGLRAHQQKLLDLLRSGSEPWQSQPVLLPN